MPFINYASQEVNCKLVYCGPGLSGKTTNILQIFRSIKPEYRGRMISLFTEAERTIFFDFLPVDLGLVCGFRVRFHLYSVPGQVFHAATRRLVFRGVDAVIFVADSLKSRMEANYEAIRDLQENLAHYGIELDSIPYVLQLNKRDMGHIHDVEFLTRELRIGGEPVYQAVAAEGEGVRDTLKDVARQLLHRLEQELLSNSVQNP